MNELKQKKKSAVTLVEAVLFVLVLALSGALVYFQTNHKQTEWDKVAAISSHVIRDLSESGWNPETVKDYGTPSLKEWVKTSKDLDALNSALTKLGSIKEEKGIELLAINKVSGVVITQVDYTNGNAAITINFKKDDEKWLVDKININSPQLKDATAKQPQAATASAPAQQPAKQ